MKLKKLFTKKPNVPSAALNFEHLIDWCGGCYWREIKRHQKCSCCRRNQNMKDNYEPILRGGAGGGSENE